MLKAVIIDDDKVSREFIKSYINFTDFMILEAEFGNPLIALEKIDKMTYDVIFLDIEMPEMNGMDFIESVKNMPQVVIISSNPEYAAESYNYDVTDYLVKPIEYQRFLKAAERVRAIHETINLNAPADEKYIFVKSGTDHIKLNFSDILFIEAFADYVQIHTAQKRHTILSTMKSIHSKLGDEEFVRVHRSYIVALNKIETFSENEVSIGGHKVKVSRKFKKDLKERLKHS